MSVHKSLSSLSSFPADCSSLIERIITGAELLNDVLESATFDLSNAVSVSTEDNSSIYAVVCSRIVT